MEKGMAMKKLSVTAALLAAAFVFGSPPAEAAPMAPVHLVGDVSDRAGIVEQVHGSHRACSRTARGRWHYHRGRARISCAPRRNRSRVVVVTPGSRVVVKEKNKRVIVRPN